MGTHPIFESDFDCLTGLKMSDDENMSDGDIEVVNDWLDFFADAGIPPNAAAQYALNFSDQRIPMDKSILGELSNEELKELGVELLGDRLAIKNYAKSNKNRSKEKRRPRSARSEKQIKKEPKVTAKQTNNEEGDDEIARVLSTVKSKTKFV